MASKYYVISLLALLSSCAQVGTITGGNQDVTAPKPDMDLMEPKNATINYTGNTFVIPFDEYFQLNNPAQTVKMVPPHATVKAEMKKKTLYLSWSDTLEANTTYAIYLNGTVKDLTEGNDTTLQLVFSTGSQLDTISYTVAVIDAFSGEPLSNVTVALFDPQTDKLKSLTRSNKGVATLNYLSAGDYKMIAFEDKNLDLEIQDEERIGFPEGATVTIDTNYFDSIPIRTFEPLSKQRYKVKSFIPPGTFELESSAPIRYYGLKHAKINGVSAAVFTNNEEEKYYVVSPDTLGGSLAEIEITHLTDSTDLTDTLTYRFRNKERNKPVRLRAIHGTNISPDENLIYELYGGVNEWIDSSIQILNLKDSSIVSDYTISANEHQLLVYFEDGLKGDYMITFKAGAIITPFGNTTAFTEKITLLEESDFGTLSIDLSGYSEPIILEMLRKDKVFKRFEVKDPSEVLTLSLLAPETYTFRVIRDKNSNGLWDIGNLETLQQPEKVDSYSKSTKVRANWEIEISLNPVKNE